METRRPSTLTQIGNLLDDLDIETSRRDQKRLGAWRALRVALPYLRELPAPKRRDLADALERDAQRFEEGGEPGIARPIRWVLARLGAQQ